MAFDDKMCIGRTEIEQAFDAVLASQKRTDHSVVLREILDNLQRIDFNELAGLPPEQRPTQKQQRVITVQEVLRTASELNCGLCRNQDFVYAFNGEFWQLLDRNELEAFLGEAAEKLGVGRITSLDYEFKGKLLKQFLTQSQMSGPRRSTDRVLINCQNGTVEFSSSGYRLRAFDRQDFLTYQLTFEYDETATAPQWQRFLDEVLPDKQSQLVLAEYFGSVFAKGLKLEKTLILLGSGANGKSVVFEVINALLGRDNVSNVSLESLGGDQHYRAIIANKLLNYAPEISGRLKADKFKQLTSGEPIEARLPYGQPMILEGYARLAFNCNDLPTDVEHSEAFFRRFLIIPFPVTIHESRRDPSLASKIIARELGGVFNWLLAGLERLLAQGGFSPCEAVTKMLEKYRMESDSVAMFLADEGFVKSESSRLAVNEIYGQYKTYCFDNTYRALGRNKFCRRLEALGIPRIESYRPFFALEKADRGEKKFR